MKKGFSIFLVVMQVLVFAMALWLSGCLDDMILDEIEREFIITDMPIQDVSIQLLESYPYQVHVRVTGSLDGGCTSINKITQQREGNTIRIHITTKRPKNAPCTKNIRFVTENIALEGGFLPGKYKVIVNNFEKDFEIQGNDGNIDRGTLQGKVTIGPLCPVEPCNLPQEKIAAIYQARKVIVYQQATKRRVAAVNLDGNGKYSILLDPGNYIVDISDDQGNPLPLERNQRPLLGSAIPQAAEIKAGEITIVDFDIDTGIR